MIGALSRLRRCRRGVAAVEFALSGTLLMITLGGITDFGLALRDKSRLANAVAQGVQYAYLHPASTSGQIQTVVQSSSLLPHVAAVVAIHACYCVTGTPPALAAAATCGTNCSDGTSPATYVVITATSPYNAILPGFSTMAGTTTITQAATVRIP